MNERYDVIIVGAGIMGLMTAYYASGVGKKVLILEKSTIGNKKASSFGLTRSIRNDYLDPQYAKLSWRARELWDDLEKLSAEKFIINCGCLNIAKKSITSNLSKTYANKSYEIISKLKFQSKKLTKKELQKNYPQFDADIGTLDQQAGFLYVPAITKLMLKLLDENKVKLLQRQKIESIEERQNEVVVKTKSEKYIGKKVVITSGIWVNEILKLIGGNKFRLPITLDKPKECRYFTSKQMRDFVPESLPVFAYLDIGIYGHPVYVGKTKGIKIGYYNPPDFKGDDMKIKGIDDFIRECMPSLKGARSETVKDADQCYYDLVEDDDFIIGALPNFKNIFVGAGWRGTGYKFAPLVGRVLAQLSLNKKTDYDIKNFDPKRFIYEN